MLAEALVKPESKNGGVGLPLTFLVRTRSAVKTPKTPENPENVGDITADALLVHHQHRGD
jgi:hypothetical protein